jgi:uncharacterized protein YbjT (DUF2867 family)
VARILIVGCGCRGRELAAALIEDGHRVRGTTRDADRLPEVEAACGEASVADPDLLGTLLPLLEGVSVVCWLMGSADGPADAIAALHGPRLASLLAKLVDTPVRGLVYEAAGTVSAPLLAEGGVIARAAAVTYRMPVQVVEEGPADVAAWVASMRAAVGDVLGA